MFDVAQMSSAEVALQTAPRTPTDGIYARSVMGNSTIRQSISTPAPSAAPMVRSSFEARCKACRDAQTVEDNRTRYQTCADYRELRKQSSRKYYESLSPVARKAAARKRAQREDAAGQNNNSRMLSTNHEQRSADFAALRERYERELAEIAANYEPMLQHLTKRLVQQENIASGNERGSAA